MTRVLVVADPPESAAALAALLSERTELVVIGALAGAVRWLQEGDSTPDVDVVVIEPDPDAGPPPVPWGAEAGGQERAAWLLLLDDPEPGWIAESLGAGVRGVLPRSAEVREIAAAVEAVAAGLVVMPPELLTPLSRSRARGAPVSPTPPSVALTPREIQVLRLLAEGRGNKGIGARLGISAYTVKAHVASVLAKLGVATRAEAVAAGVRWGLIPL